MLVRDLPFQPFLMAMPPSPLLPDRDAFESCNQPNRLHVQGFVPERLARLID
jgi:hypothetical protein